MKNTTEYSLVLSKIFFCTKDVFGRKNFEILKIILSFAKHNCKLSTEYSKCKCNKSKKCQFYKLGDGEALD